MLYAKFWSKVLVTKLLIFTVSLQAPFSRVGKERVNIFFLISSLTMKVQTSWLQDALYI